MQIRVSHPTPVGTGSLATSDLVTSTVGDATELLDVYVDELAGPAPLIATDGLTCGPVEMVQALHVVAHEHPVDRRRRHPESSADAMRPELVDAPAGEDAPLESLRGLPRRASWPAGTVTEPLGAQLLVATPPLVGALAGDAHGIGGVGDGPTGLDPLAQQQSTGGGQRSVTVGHEDLRVGELASTPAHLHPEVFVLVDPYRVNNVRGKYI
jgi:hypothetical protein